MINESELIRKAQSGDVAAFEQLVESYQQSVFNIAYRTIGNYDDAADMAQEAFVKVFLKLSEFKEGSKFSTWIYRITTNVCLDEFRRRKKRPSVSMSTNIETEDGDIVREIEDESSNIEANYEREEQLKIVNRAIAKLPENQRAVIVMRDINEMSYDDISAVLKCSVGTVKSRISRARDALHEILKKDGLFD